MKGNNPLLVLLAITAGLIGPVQGQRYLTGELSGSYPAGEYVVSGNIHVLPKAKLTFEPGCTLRFENFTGIVVRGGLLCKGTALKPIVFTSSRDMPSSRTIPEAFDWNGIKVTSEADAITLENCLVAYSTFGLNIESEATPVSITDVKFTNNGSASLTRGKKMVRVTENSGTTFIWPEMSLAGNMHSSSLTAATDGGQADGTGSFSPVATDSPKADSTSRQKKQKIGWKLPVRVTLGSTAVVGGVVWIAGYAQSGKYKRLSNSFLDGGLKATEITDYDRANNNIKKWGTVQNIGAGIFSTAALGLMVTFLF